MDQISTGGKTDDGTTVVVLIVSVRNPGAPSSAEGLNAGTALSARTNYAFAYQCKGY